MKPTGNPWIDRFDPNISENEMRARAQVKPKSLTHLDKQSLAVATEELRQALGAVFVLTSQGAQILRRLLGAAHAYMKRSYRDAAQCREMLYLERIPPCETMPICLTSLSGEGKSALFRAFRRLVGDPITIDIPNHSGVSLDACWILRAGERSTLRNLFQDYLDGPCRSSDRGLSIEDMLRKIIYRHGVGLLLLDELQFIATGSSSSVMASNTLMSMMRLGPPIVYASNFSLVHRFEKRPQEERRRLLWERMVLAPDSCKGSNWAATFEALQNVAPEFSDLDLQREGGFVHEHSFGIKGYAAKLLLLAYIASRRSGSASVKAVHLEKASRADDYLLEREDVALLERMTLGIGPVKDSNRRLRTDLWCPFNGDEKKSNVEQAQAMIEEHKKRVAQRMVESTCTAGEREGLKQRKKASGANRSAAAKVIAIRRRPEASLAALLAGGKNFREAAGKQARRNSKS